MKNQILGIILFLTTFITASQNQKVTFEKDVEQLISTLKLPAMAIGIAKGDKPIYFYSHGFADNLDRIKISKDHIFPIASITKIFTSVTLMRMENQGKLKLTDFLNDYKNEFFNVNRWSKDTQLFHILSHTSESKPIGSNFIYNGSKYNLVFNAISELNKEVSIKTKREPFAIEVDTQILSPLKLQHTLVDYQPEHDEIKKWISEVYYLDEVTGQFSVSKPNIENLYTGAAFGMMSSVSDLLKFSNGITSDLLTENDFSKLTKPFYKNSPHGLGWFSFNFEGLEMFWGYGYESNASAILLKIPSKDLTLVVLSPSSLLSSSTRLGFGNPLNSFIIASFVKSFVLDIQQSINYEENNSNLEIEINKALNKSSSRIMVEELFSMALHQNMKPDIFKTPKNLDTFLINYLIDKFPNDPIWQTTSSFELLANSNDKKVLDFALGVVNAYIDTKSFHPAKHYFSSEIYKKNNLLKDSIEVLEELCKDDSFREQPYKLNGILQLAIYYQDKNKSKTIDLLERLITYKEYISVKDDSYNKAKELINKLKK